MSHKRAICQYSLVLHKCYYRIGRFFFQEFDYGMISDLLMVYLMCPLQCVYLLILSSLRHPFNKVIYIHHLKKLFLEPIYLPSMRFSFLLDFGEGYFLDAQVVASRNKVAVNYIKVCLTAILV